MTRRTLSPLAGRMALGVAATTGVTIVLLHSLALRSFGESLAFGCVALLVQMLVVRVGLARAIEEHSDRLEQAVAERTAALCEANSHAEAAARAKGSLLANMSHEIRTPMTAIVGFSEILTDPTSDDSERSAAVQAIHRNGEHLVALLNDILDVSKIDAEKMGVERRRIEPAAIMADAVGLLSEKARSKHITLVSESRGPIPAWIESDAVRLRQALVNLIGNAVKFTDTGGVRVVMSCDWQAQRIQFEVSDTGVGMTAEQVTRLFRPFEQADVSTTRRFGGTGLGLTITKHIATALCGAVTVRSEPGKGSTFVLTIATGDLRGAATASDADPAKPEEPRNEPLPRLAGRVLLAEDGPDNQRLLSLLLRKAGAEVTLADNGQIALEHALAAWRGGDAFDIILMDMQMPVMDGYSATRALRSAGYRGQIIALTAHALKDELEKCLAAGCDLYLSKPIRRAELIRTLAERMSESLSLSEPACALREASGLCPAPIIPCHS